MKLNKKGGMEGKKEGREEERNREREKERGNPTCPIMFQVHFGSYRPCYVV